jgi:DNA-binding response OmpR family regulator
MRILIVEDDLLLSHGLKQGLERAGMVADYVAGAKEADQATAALKYDLAIVDIGLPGTSGLDWVRKLRTGGAELPVLILTARDTLEDCVSSLDIGADDFMTKPFRLPEVAARVRALVRRVHSRTNSRLFAGALEMDMSRHQVYLHGKALELTGREWSILEKLVVQAPNVVTKENLVQAISGWDATVTVNAIEVYVSRLRTKLDQGGIGIRTVRGIGYRLEEPQSA